MKKFSNVVEMVREANQQELSDLQKSYREYFGAKLKKFNVESPADLNDEQKKEFFNEIKKDWEKGSGAKPAGKKDVEEHGVKESEEVNESALAIAGGIILGALGLNLIAKIFKGVSAGVSLMRVTDPGKMKEIANQISSELITNKGINPLQAVLWQKTVEGMIDKGEIKNAYELAKTIKGVSEIDLKKVFEEEGVDISGSENVNESLWLAGGLVVLTVLGIKGIRNIVENMRIEKNLNKEIEPAKLKETMQKIWDETNAHINPSEKAKAKAWLDECLSKVDTGEMKTLKDFQTSLNAQVFEGEWAESSEDVNEAKINEKDIKNKEDFEKFVKDKLKKVHGDDFDEEKAQKVIDGLSKDAEKSGDWGAAVGKLNKA